MSGYPKATCDPGTVALRLANERADRWKQRHDALATRLASVEALVADWQANGNSRELGDPRADVWHKCAEQLLAVLGSDAHTEQQGTGR